MAWAILATFCVFCLIVMEWSAEGRTDRCLACARSVVFFLLSGDAYVCHCCAPFIGLSVNCVENRTKCRKSYQMLVGSNRHGGHTCSRRMTAKDLLGLGRVVCCAVLGWNGIVELGWVGVGCDVLLDSTLRSE